VFVPGSTTTCDVTTTTRDETIVTDEVASAHTVVVSIVNPQGIITTVNESQTLEFVENKFDDNYILENCDETMFRPVITVMTDHSKQMQLNKELDIDECSKPVEMPLELVVPVIDERVMEEKKRMREVERSRKEQEAAAAAKKLKEEVAVVQTKKGKKAQKFGKKEPEQKKQPIVVQKPSQDELKTDKLPIKREEEAVVEVFEEKKIEIDNKSSFVEDKKEAEAPPPLVEVEKLKTKATKVVNENKKKPKEEKIEAMVEEPQEEWDFSSQEPPVEVKKEPETIIIDFPALGEEKKETKKEAKKWKKEKKVKEVTPEVEIPPECTDTEQQHDMEIQQEPSVEAVPPKVISFLQVMQSVDSPKPQKVETIELPKPIAAVIETAAPKSDSWKRNKKNKKKTSPVLDMPLPQQLDIDDHKEIDKEAIMKISMHETIGDDEIQIVPLEEILTIQDNSPQKDGEQQTFIKNEDFYDIDDELPPLEPFDGTFDLACGARSCEQETKVEKKEMKKTMSDLLKDTNMVFAMCSSLKELKADEESKSMSSSEHIQRSTSSSLTTNTTTATFASASSQQIGEGLDSDYRSLELEMEEAAQQQQEEEEEEPEFKIPLAITKSSSIEKDDAEDISSFEATSSETDDSSKAVKFKREDDEELRPLLETSTTSLSLPVSSGSNTLTTTEANETSTLPETNQKPQATSNNSKRKNKKKRR
jgi:hypothetical protein